MTTRTLQFYGSGYATGGTEPISITAELNNIIVYSGTILHFRTFSTAR